MSRNGTAPDKIVALNIRSVIRDQRRFKICRLRKYDDVSAHVPPRHRVVAISRPLDLHLHSHHHAFSVVSHGRQRMITSY